MVEVVADIYYMPISFPVRSDGYAIVVRIRGSVFGPPLFRFCFCGVEEKACVCCCTRHPRAVHGIMNDCHNGENDLRRAVDGACMVSVVDVPAVVGRVRCSRSLTAGDTSAKLRNKQRSVRLAPTPHIETETFGSVDQGRCASLQHPTHSLCRRLRAARAMGDDEEEAHN